MHATKLQTSGASRLHIFWQDVIENTRSGECPAFVQSEYWESRPSSARSPAEMVALVKIKGFVIDSLFAVDSPISSAVGLRFFSGFRVSTFSSSTAQPLHSAERARHNQHPRDPLSRLDI